MGTLQKNAPRTLYQLSLAAGKSIPIIVNKIL